MRARTGARRPQRPGPAPAPTVEQWIDEGVAPQERGLRDAARAATRRAATVTAPPRPRSRGALADDTVEAIGRAVGARRAARLVERLTDAAGALERERYGDARRMAAALMNDIGDIAAVHEIFGLASYRLGKWRDAVRALEAARERRSDVALLPVLADSYRALRRYAKVEEIWREVRETSPAHDVMAEARIVAAGALADRGDLPGALRLMEPTAAAPKRVRELHLRQWYVLGDLYDRAGEVLRARQMFSRVVAADPDFADASDRLGSLGR